MPDQDMAVVVVAAAAAAIAVGGAALALTYRCCPEILGKHRKKNKVDDEVHHHRPKDDDPCAASEHLQRDELDQHHFASGYSRKTNDEEVRSSLLEQPKKRPATARSVEEIKARYGRATKSDAGAAAGLASQARNKLMERGEKLKNIDDKTEELQSQAESFASLAEELANKMKSRKWWELF